MQLFSKGRELNTFLQQGRYSSMHLLRSLQDKINCKIKITHPHGSQRALVAVIQWYSEEPIEEKKVMHLNIP